MGLHYFFSSKGLRISSDTACKNALILLDPDSSHIVKKTAYDELKRELSSHSEQALHWSCLFRPFLIFYSLENELQSQERETNDISVLGRSQADRLRSAIQAANEYYPIMLHPHREERLILASLLVKYRSFYLRLSGENKVSSSASLCFTADSLDGEFERKGMTMLKNLCEENEEDLCALIAYSVLGEAYHIPDSSTRLPRNEERAQEYDEKADEARSLIYKQIISPASFVCAM